MKTPSQVKSILIYAFSLLLVIFVPVYAAVNSDIFLQDNTPLAGFFAIYIILLLLVILTGLMLLSIRDQSGAMALAIATIVPITLFIVFAFFDYSGVSLFFCTIVSLVLILTAISAVASVFLYPWQERLVSVIEPIFLDSRNNLDWLENHVVAHLNQNRDFQSEIRNEAAKIDEGIEKSLSSIKSGERLTSRAMRALGADARQRRTDTSNLYAQVRGYLEDQIGARAKEYSHSPVSDFIARADFSEGAPLIMERLLNR